METDDQRLTRFHADFEKLRRNRERVPLQKLRTIYARSYNTLVAEVMDGAVWFYRKYMADLAFPTCPQDEAGNKWLADKIAAIEADEKGPGGLLGKFETALIEHLDMEGYEDLLARSYERRLREAFGPYWRRHCKRLGNGWVYNRIFCKFWLPPERSGLSIGYWINADHTGQDPRYPPDI